MEGITDTLGSMLEEAASALSAAGFEEPRRRARRLISAALGLTMTEVLCRPEREPNQHEAGTARAWLRRLLAHEPLSRIAGRREFWGLEFSLSPDTLDPRPDSETVVEAVLRRLPERNAPLRILDLGTGTGCLLLALLSEHEAAFGIGIDAAVGAVTTARGNARSLGLDDRAGFYVGDWATALCGRFDIVVANPPYVAAAAGVGLPPEVSRYDPWLALDGGEDGLAAYRAIAADLRAVLAAGGLFAGEVGVGQAAAVCAILEAAGLVIDGLDPDLAGIVRCVVARNCGADRASHGRRQKTVGMSCAPV